MRVGRLFQFFFCVCSICNSWRSHAGTGCESRGARGWDAWRVAAASLLVACFPFPSHSLPFPPSQHVFLFGSGGTGDQTRAANMSLAPRPRAMDRGRPRCRHACTYICTIQYGGGEGGDRPPTTTNTNRARVWRTRWPTRQCTWAEQGSERLKRQ